MSALHPREHRLPRFRPILAGGSLGDRLVACAGSAAGILLTGLVGWWMLGSLAPLPVLVAPMGASAVLVFAVPASPLAQPWPVIGGNIVSALVGVVVAHCVPEPRLAAAVAVGGAILAMSLTRSLHPPGGAAALTAVIGGPAVAAAGYAFPLLPVGLNAAVLTLAGVLFHRLSGHSYPHRPPAVAPPVPRAPALHPDDVDLALAEVGETFDIGREDLLQILNRVEQHAARRAGGAIGPPRR